MKVIRKEAFAKTVWKNGGGVTHEAIRMPPGPGPFLWRVSVASIEKSGPFSDFAGYERRMVLLQGRGLALTFADGGRSELREIGDWMEFDGGIPAGCDLIDGSCMDFNLMTAKSLRTAAKLEQLSGSHSVTAGDGETVVIFSLAAALTLHDGTAPSIRLNPWDLAVMPQGSAWLEPADAGSTQLPLAVFIATISQ